MAKLIVRTHLQDGRWHRGKLLLDFAGDRGISHGTVDAVATALGVERRMAAKWGWIWRLPDDATVRDDCDSGSSRRFQIMNAEELLSSLRKRNLLVRLRDGKLQIGPTSRLTGDDREAIKRTRQDLVRLLSRKTPELSAADTHMVDKVRKEFNARLVEVRWPELRQAVHVPESPKAESIDRKRPRTHNWPVPVDDPPTAEIELLQSATAESNTESPVKPDNQPTLFASADPASPAAPPPIESPPPLIHASADEPLPKPEPQTTPAPDRAFKISFGSATSVASDLPAFRDHIRSRRAALAGFMEQGALLAFENNTLTVFPRNDIYVRYLADNRQAISQLATEFFGCAVKVELAGPKLHKGQPK